MTLKTAYFMGSGATEVDGVLVATTFKGTETNPSGITPFDHKVLIKPDKVDAVTKGGVYLPETAKEAEQYASVKATVVAVGDNAFFEWGGANKPVVGQRVMVAKYSGLNIKGDDKEDYRLCNDEDIVAGIS